MVPQGHSGILNRALCVLGLTAGLLPSAPAFADNADLSAITQGRADLPYAGAAAGGRDSTFTSAFSDFGSDFRPAEPAPRPAAAVVMFGRALDLSGQKRIYSSRRSISGLGAVIVFLDRRPRPVLLAMPGLRYLSLPSGMPVSARSLSSGFGMRYHPLLGTRRLHAGIDLAAPLGTPIVATSDGVVSTADWTGGYGLLVGIEHGAGLQTRYGHMSQLAVVRGQSVRKGEVIGYVGSTGRSTGPHLHYEMRINGRAINPAR